MPSASPPADLLLYGGTVITQNPTQPTAEAVAIAADTIIAVGSESELRPFVSQTTQTLSCSGRTVLPGFIDPHLHLFAWASRFCGADLSRVRSIPELRQSLAVRLPYTSPGEWLRGYGYDAFFLAEKRHPTRQDLDAVSRDQPILLRHRTGHAAVLNTLALQKAGIDRNFVPPCGGSVECDAAGEPTGVLYELEAFLRTVIPPLPAHSFAEGIKKAGRELLRLGVTSFHDASAGNSLKTVSLFRKLKADKQLIPRATVMIGIDAFPQLLDAELRPFSGDDQVRFGSIKIMLHESQGSLSPDPAALKKMVWQAHRHGFQLAFHAVEEAAIGVALDALKHAQQRLRRTDHRHRIEHCSLCPGPFLEQLAATGCAVVTQPGFLYWYGEKYRAEVDPALHHWLYRNKSLLNTGIPVAGSSDCPIAPLAPLKNIQAAISRQSRTGIIVNQQERLSLSEALSLFTSAAAWVGFEEDTKGRIAPGLLADLIVLDGEITAVPVEALSSLSVATTIVGGKVVWEK